MRQGKVRRVLGYARVSGHEQARHGTSLEAQQGEIERWCKAQGYPAPDIRVEAESAGAEKLERRAVLRGLIDDARKGDLVVVSRQDRWSRDTLFYLQSTAELTRCDVGFFSIAEAFDPSTPEGKFAATIMAAVAEQERARIYQRTVGTRKALRDKGQYVEGLPPFGYERGKGNILQPTDAAPAARDLFEWCIAGQSLRDLAASLLEVHGIRRDRQVLRKLLRNRVYVGEVKTSRGDWIASHEPVISRRTFDRAQRALDSRRLGGRKPSSEARTASWLLRGLAACRRCGAGMGPAYGDYGHDYYACHGRTYPRRDCDAPYIRVDRADKLVAEMVRERLTEMRAELREVKSLRKPKPVDYTAQRRRQENKRDRLIDLAADGTISREELSAKLATVDLSMANIAEREAAADAELRATKPTVRRKWFKYACSLQSAWANAPVDKRRNIIARLAERIELDSKRKPRIEWKPIHKLKEG